MILVAIDPGVMSGFARLERSPDGAVRVLSYGEIPVLGTDAAALVRSVHDWLEGQMPLDELAMEGPLTGSRVTHVEVHEVRGVLRYWADCHRLPLTAYHPATVKRVVAGHGLATKAAVAHVVRYVFDLPRLPTDHVSDALAVALTHLVTVHGYEIPQLPEARYVAVQAQRRRRPRDPRRRG